MERLMNLTRSWINVVCSVESLTPELVCSACRHLPDYSEESANVFWALVQQDFNARYSDSKQVQELQQQWEKIRPSVAKFHHVLTKFWPNEPANRLDILPSEKHHKILKQALQEFQIETEEEFKYLGVWNILVRHSKWEQILRSLVVGAKSTATASGVLKSHTGKASPGKKKHKRTLKRKGVVVVDSDSEEKESHPQELDEENAGRWVRILPKPTGCVTPTGSDGNPGETTGSGTKQTHPSKKQRVAGNKQRKNRGVMQAISNAGFLEQVHEAPSQSGTPMGSSKLSLQEQDQAGEDISNKKTPEVPEMDTISDRSFEGSQRVDDVHLALAWIGVSCSFADATLKLEETYDWFWFLVSSYYYDSRTHVDYRCDIENILKKRWLDLRSRVATFHSIYEEVLAGRKKPARIDREEMIAQALEVYWKKAGYWFQHRAVWEILERHVDWETVLKPLLLQHDDSKAVQIVHPIERIEGGSLASNKQREQDTGQVQKDPQIKKRAREPISIPGVYKECQLPLPSVEDLHGAGAAEKQSPQMVQWLELSSRRLELEVMTHKDDGLTPEALEYLSLQRQQILHKTRLEMQPNASASSDDL